MPERDDDLVSQRRVSIVISVASVILAVIHLLVPKLTIDGTTTVLFIIAVVPWLGPVFKTIQGPGGWKVEFRDLRREVAQGFSESRDRVAALTDRVEKLALAFSGAVSTEQQRSMTDDLERFCAYLRAQGIEVPSRLPTVQGVPGLQKRKERFVDYDPDSMVIHIDSESADDTDLLLYTYAEHLLVFPIQRLPPQPGHRGAQVEAERESYAGGEQSILRAIALYLVCSFRGDPRCMRRTVPVNLDNDSRFEGSDPSNPVRGMYAERDFWGAMFWDARASLTAKVTDPLLIMAWMQAQALPDPKRQFRQIFVGQLLAIASQHHGSKSARLIENTLRERGFEIEERNSE